MAANGLPCTSWASHLPPYSTASPIPRIRAFPRAALLARSHAPRATCRTTRSPPCSAPSTALYPAAADVLRIAERCRQRACAPQSASRSCCVGLPPGSATCSKPRPSGYLLHPPFSPIKRYWHSLMLCCCRRASHRGALLSTRWRTAGHFAFAATCRTPVLPRAALPAQLYRAAVDVRRIAERCFRRAGARPSTARSRCDGDAMKRY